MFCLFHILNRNLVVFTCTSVMISDVKHFFLCLLAIFISSFVKGMFMSFAHFLLSSCRISSYILGTDPLSDIHIADIHTVSYVLPAHRLAIYLLDGVFWWIEVWLCWNPSSWFLFLVFMLKSKSSICFSYHAFCMLRNHCLPQSQR